MTDFESLALALLAGIVVLGIGCFNVLCHIHLALGARCPLTQPVPEPQPLNRRATDV